MKLRGNFSVRKLCLLIGIGLLAGALVTLAVWQWNINASKEKSHDYIQLLRETMPDPVNATLEERRDNSMPVLSVEGTDFVGIIEMPRYNLALPVCAEWGQSSETPCLFSGSIYNSTLQIGATSQKGQFDFYREISVGDQIYFTDMEGNRYTLEVTGLRYEDHIDQTALQKEDAAMTLFVKNLYAFDYLVVYCNAVE